MSMMGSGSLMRTGYEEIIHFNKCMEDGGFSSPQSPFDPFNPFSYKTEIEEAHEKLLQKEAQYKALMDIQGKLQEIEKQGTASKFWVENMRGALQSLKDEDPVSSMQFLISVLIDAQENRP